mmetsp:Transcript_9624/g.34256  ORF Transcript_9624/g.34256 Transcript_9624/m.34256 type:complete len:508 (-) Transcript_9624:89-1612(-)|eukprot:CAMPEP_0203970738 /NCGR_PEP_ID=MMETSP0359-20131031/98118_1 /ASSEMBLY_ACC=CAM_ASM_000338 /TAXON_ID=268821 /ORGANISM="Scrippsiella Hangoei, Strain SHTV-5" /LENGTH=507 /DNA_ID=CAMNT_0050908697 /DNA_START=66 /DNA_END=1589 /DNA_ORIENTATION=-
MNGLQLRALPAQDLHSLCTDCGLGPPPPEGGEAGAPTASSGRPTREQMIARILAWQQREQQQQQQHQQQQPRPVGAASCPPDAPRPVAEGCVATPARARGRQRKESAAESCTSCHWKPIGGACACGLAELDPLTPVLEVLAFAAIAPESRVRPHLGSARFDLRYQPLASGQGLELRMGSSTDTRQHRWPQSLAVFAAGSKIVQIDPPREDGPHRRDAPLLLAHFLAEAATKSASSNGDVLVEFEVSADAAPGLVKDWLVAVVRTGPPRGVPELMASCLASPPMLSSTSARLLASLRAGEESMMGAAGEAAVQFATPWTQPLVCPVSRERLRVPARGLACEHLRCFELEAYLVASFRAVFHRRWHCPICDCPLVPTSLAICELTQRLLREAPLGVAEADLESMRCTEDGEVTVGAKTPPRRMASDPASEVKALPSTRVVSRRWRRAALQPSTAELQPNGSDGCGGESEEVQIIGEEPAAKRRLTSFGNRLVLGGQKCTRTLTLQLSID